MTKKQEKQKRLPSVPKQKKVWYAVEAFNDLNENCLEFISDTML